VYRFNISKDTSTKHHRSIWELH